MSSKPDNNDNERTEPFAEADGVVSGVNKIDVALPVGWSDVAIETRFADLLDGQNQDLFDLGRAPADAHGRPSEAVQTALQRGRVGALDDPQVDEILESLLDELGADVNEDEVGSGSTDSSGSASKISRRQQPPMTAECETAYSKLIALGSAVDSMTADIDASFTRLQRACLIALRVDEVLARRVVAADVARQLPDMSVKAMAFAECSVPRDVERLGIELAGLIDQRAQIIPNKSLHAEATAVLMVALRWPIIRMEPKSEAGSSSLPFDESPRLRVLPRQPFSDDVLQAVLAKRDGLLRLPFEESQFSISDLVLRVAAALHSEEKSVRKPTEDLARLERVMIGLGLLLAGATPGSRRIDHSLPALAHDLASQRLNHTLDELQEMYRDKLAAVETRRAEQIRRYRTEAEELEKRLKLAEDALAKLGPDDNGNMAREDHVDGAGRKAEAIVCPPVPNRTHTKVRDAVLGHEQLIDQPVPLVEVGDLPSKRAQLLEEFPYARMLLISF